MKNHCRIYDCLGSNWVNKVEQIEQKKNITKNRSDVACPNARSPDLRYFQLNPDFVYSILPTLIYFEIG